MTISPRVIDLSHYDDVQDGFAGAVRMGIWGVINKVTQGVGVVDASFDWRQKPATKAGLLFGCYHFLTPGRIPEQVTWFLSHIGVNGFISSDTLLALDWEQEGNKTPASLSEAQQWIQGVHDKVGRWPVLYLGGAVRDKIPARKSPFWSNLRLWHPQYGPRPSAVPKSQWPNGAWLWQYTGDGVGPSPHTVPGIKPLGKLDINHYPNSRDQLRAEWAS